MNAFLRLLAVVSIVVLTGCASNQSAQQQAATNDERDPLEGVNRVVWDFNYDVLDAYILKPAAHAYVDYMPDFARVGLYNMALNLEEPANAVNNLLQGKVTDSFASLGRFAINSTIGFLGAVDTASHMGLARKEEEFGEVLGVYDIDTGPYLMLPALGPSDMRSFVGNAVDASYFTISDLNFYLQFLRTGVKAIEARAQVIEQEELLESSLDPYAFVKDAYFQNLRFKVYDGRLPDDDLSEDDEDFDAFMDDLDLDDLDDE